MDTRLDESFSRRRFSIFLLAVFAALALVLAMVGLYGVISYAVAQRAQEIGIRAALGAGAADLVRLVVGEGLALAIAGVVLGLALSAALSSVVTSQLFQMKAIDPVLYAMAGLLMLCMAVLACWAPGWRAARIDPAVTLRSN